MELIRHQWLLDDVQHESLVSSTTGFAAIGAVCSGTFNRKFGRKPVLIGASIVFTVAAIIMALSRNFVASCLRAGASSASPSAARARKCRYPKRLPGPNLKILAGPERD